MRTRNIKINVYLNEAEKKMLEEKSSKTKLSQSDFIRNLIYDFKKNSLSNNEINNIVNNLLESINDLIKLKQKLHYLGYFEDEEFLQYKIQNLQFLANKIKNQ